MAFQPREGDFRKVDSVQQNIWDLKLDDMWWGWEFWELTSSGLTH